MKTSTTTAIAAGVLVLDEGHAAGGEASPGRNVVQRKKLGSRRLASALACTLLLSAATPALSAQGDHLVISNLKVPNRNQLQAGVPYEGSVDIRTPGAPVQLQQLCFYWNKEGPYCFSQFKMRKGPDGGVHPTIGLKTGNPGKYKLTAVMTYSINGKTYETNQTSVSITVK